MTIFGISVGTDRCGICILQDGVLLDIQVHSFQTLWSEEKSHKIIKRLRYYLHAYPIHAIILKVPPLKQHTPAITKLLRKIERLANEYYCEFDLITKTELKGYSLMRKNSELIKYTKLLYPDLTAIYEKGAATGHGYYKKIYEAVLAAHIYQERKRLKS